MFSAVIKLSMKKRTSVLTEVRFLTEFTNLYGFTLICPLLQLQQRRQR